MQWAEVTARPSSRKLRQFAGLWLVFFCGLALWRWLGTGVDARGTVIAIAGLSIGILGLISPSAIRLVYTAWMVAAFPIGWTMSRLMLGLLFFGLFTPVAAIFRLIGRDALNRRQVAGRGQAAGRGSYWTAKPASQDPGDYFRQS
jgi:hypothetical protein